MIVLRQYQETMISQARSLMQSGVKSLILCAPTGSGKTLLTAHMLGTAASKGLRSIFCVHRVELIRQSSAAFVGENIQHSIIAAGFHGDPYPKVQIASIQTLAKRLDRVMKPDMIVFDEAHHVAAGSWQKVADKWPKAWRIGLTATPERLDGKGLGPWFERMVLGPSVQALIGQGYLSKYRLFAPPSEMDLTGVKTVAGDYDQQELNKRVDKPSIVGCAITEYKRHADGKRALVRAVSIEHSKHIADQFRAAGVPAEHVDGGCTPEYRKAAMDRFVSGQTLVLSQVALWNEGVDIPAVVAVIDLRPTRSLTLALQFWGRALRPCVGKDEAIIIDHAQNWSRHGLPCDSRKWTLEDKRKRLSGSDGGGPSARLCGHCFACVRSGVMVCPYCGFRFEAKPREIEERQGDLKEVDIESARRSRKREEGACDTLEDFQELGKQRGYAPGWAWQRWSHRRLARRAKEVARV